MANPQNPTLVASGSGRPSRPCDACRRRKSRCVTEEKETICVLCKFHHQECTFLHNPVSRKRSKTQDDSRSEIRTKSKKPRLGTPIHLIRTNNGTGVEEYDDLDSYTLLRKTLGLQNQHHARLVGMTGALEPLLVRGLSEDSSYETAHCHLRRVSSTETFLILSDEKTQNYEDQVDDLDSIENLVEPHGVALINLYFRIVHPSFPILHKEVYLEKYRRSHREFSPPLLACVYLLALRWWSYSQELSGLDKPNVNKLHHLARKTLGDTIHRPKLSTIQAGLLYLQQTDGDSPELTAQLVSIGYQLGIHLDASDWTIPDWEKSLRKRLGWGLFMHDKWSALGSGYPSLINSANWDLHPVVKDDFPENADHEDDQEGSSEVEKGIMTFFHMISLTEIVSDMMDSLFTVRFARRVADTEDRGLNLVLEHAKPIQARLKSWYAGLPECLSMSSTQILKLSSVGYLRLAYLAAEITLHRLIITHTIRSPDPSLVEICRSAAKSRFFSAVGFCASLKQQHLSSVWSFSRNFCLIGTFGSLLASSATTKQEEMSYRNKLKEYRWILKMDIEAGANFMLPAITSLDSNLALLDYSYQNSTEFSPAQAHTTPEHQPVVCNEAGTVRTSLSFSPESQHSLDQITFENSPFDPYPHLNALDHPARTGDPGLQNYRRNSSIDMTHIWEV